ncbi:hypothetical protein [Pedobacter sp. SYSU D00535]|uniref:hypothetical protein n=1 Tax=Pedobacter sp. SYSU D00535 TaxID=2810308 RepID=UPI001A96599A|nr:hypothetical protein [Pedobacter sp. SYSU D00535]
MIKILTFAHSVQIQKWLATAPSMPLISGKSNSNNFLSYSWVGPGNTFAPSINLNNMRANAKTGLY